jgi:hypothetical protein
LDWLSDLKRKNNQILLYILEAYQGVKLQALAAPFGELNVLINYILDAPENPSPVFDSTVP